MWCFTVWSFSNLTVYQNLPQSSLNTGYWLHPQSFWFSKSKRGPRFCISSSSRDAGVAGLSHTLGTTIIEKLLQKYWARLIEVGDLCLAFGLISCTLWHYCLLLHLQPRNSDFSWEESERGCKLSLKISLIFRWAPACPSLLTPGCGHVTKLQWAVCGQGGFVPRLGCALRGKGHLPFFLLLAALNVDTVGTILDQEEEPTRSARLRTQKEPGCLAQWSSHTTQYASGWMVRLKVITFLTEATAILSLWYRNPPDILTDARG